jgi:hypothetical protein
MLRRFKLRFKFISRLCLVFILGFIIQGYLSTTFLHRSYVKQLQQDQFNRVATMVGTLDRKLQAAQKSLVSVSKGLPILHLDDAEILQLWLDDRRGISKIFDNGLFIFDGNGRLLCETPFKPKRRGRSYSFRPYYQETIRTGKSFISDPYISSQQHNHPAIMMTSPLFNEEGELKAILGGSFDLLGENFLGGLSQHKLGDSGYFYLAGLDRTLIVHPDPEKIMLRDLPVGANPLFDRAMEGFEGCQETVAFRGVQMLSAFKRLESKNWVLAGNYPMDEINAPLIKTRYVLWLAIGGTFIVMFFLSFISLQQIFGPLFCFTNHLENLPAKQGSECLADCSGTGEIEILVSTFNRVLHEADEARQALDYAQQMAHLGSWSWDIPTNRLIWSDEVFRIFWR